MIALPHPLSPKTNQNPENQPVVNNTPIPAPQKYPGLLLALSPHNRLRRNIFTISIVLLLISSILTDAACMAGTYQNSSDTSHFISHDTNAILSPLFVEDESERLSLPQVKRPVGMPIFSKASLVAHHHLLPLFYSTHASRKNLGMLMLVRLRI